MILERDVVVPDREVEEERDCSSRGFQDVMGTRKSRHSIMRPTFERAVRMRLRAAWWWPRK